MSQDIDNTQDVMDSRDFIARMEELQAARDALREEFDAEPANAGVDFENWVRNQTGFTSEDADTLRHMHATQARWALEQPDPTAALVEALANLVAAVEDADRDSLRELLAARAALKLAKGEA